MKKYVPTIGLEIHAELKTRTKMFCDSKNDPDETRPNVNICPVCLAHPGTLPVINKEAVLQTLRVGVALGGALADFTEFDRKNYFYPDIPKGYQISQYKHPLVTGGSLNGVAITRVHLEEDTATSLHLDSSNSPFLKGSIRRGGGGIFKSSVLPPSPKATDGRGGDSDTSFSSRGGSAFGGSKGGTRRLKFEGERESSLINFNRAGVPLMELVTEPVIHDAKSAADFARELQLLLRSLGASDANMEKGEMRVEANVSIARAMDTAELRGTNAELRRKSDNPSQRMSASGLRRSAPLGIKVEVKNLNSFRSVERAIEYEIARQSELLKRGERVLQETRGWDEEKQKTYSQRRKEESHDYRYFPDPDLPKLFLSEIPEFSEGALRASLPELPGEARERFRRDFGTETSEEVIEIFVRSAPFGKYLSAIYDILGGDASLVKLARNYSSSDLLGLLKKDFGEEWERELATLAEKIPPKNFAALARLVGSGVLSSRGAKDTLAEMYRSGGEPEKVAKEKNLIQKSNEQELLPIVKEILAAHAGVVSDYKKGKQSALQFLVGQGMKATKGAANPEVLKKLILSLI